jgi:hypothetical protein
MHETNGAVRLETLRPVSEFLDSLLNALRELSAADWTNVRVLLTLRGLKKFVNHRGIFLVTS